MPPPLLHDADPLLPSPRRSVPRSIFAFAALFLGLVLGRELTGIPASTWFSLAAGLCAVAALTRCHTCRLALALATVCLGAGWFPARILDPAPGSLRSLLAEIGPGDESVLTVHALVLESPKTRAREHDPLSPLIPDDGTVSFEASVSAIDSEAETIPTSGTLRVHFACAASIPLHAGDRVTLTGLFESIPPPLNPGETDRRLLAWQDGLAGDLRIAGPALVSVQPPPETPIATATTLCLRARAALTARAHDLLLGGAEPGPGRALLAALILGENEPGLSDVRSAFTRLGLAHILAISGFHITVMLAVVLFALRAAGDLGRLEPILASALILLYLAILPFQAPVWRSALMVLGLLAGDALGRRHDRLTTLGWIACGLIVWRPLDAWSLGLQLSFGLVALLLWLGEHAHGRIFTPPLKGIITPTSRFAWLLDHTKRLFSTNLLCAAAGSPLIAWRTGLLSPLTIFAGVVAIPPIVVLMIGAYAGLAVGVLIPPLAPAVSWLLGELALANARLVETMDRIPGASLRIPPVSLAWSAAATLFTLYCFYRAHRRDPRAWLAAAALGAWLAIELSLPALPTSTALRIDTIAVGDGTCQIVRAGNEALLWDCGSLAPGVGRTLVPRAARALGASRTPRALITHPNLDHFNGILDAAEPLGIREVCIGEAFEESARRPHSPEAYFLSELRRRGISIRVLAGGDRLQLGPATIEILSPPRAAPWPMDNDRSLVARFTVPTSSQHPRSLLLCGDIQDQAIASLESRYPALHPDIMEVPHHGSAHQAAIEWLSHINPTVALQSTGPKRANDPRWTAARAPRTWYCTALDGAAWAQIERDGTLRSGAFLHR